LGGGAYALQANSVGTRQLKNGAVTNVKLANGAVTGGKVASDSLTGKQINAGTLGLVPRAGHATNADLLGGIGATGFIHAGTIRQFGPVTVNSGGGPTLLSAPPFTVSGGCLLSSTTGILPEVATIGVTSTEAHSAESSAGTAGAVGGSFDNTSPDLAVGAGA